MKEELGIAHFFFSKTSACIKLTLNKFNSIEGGTTGLAMLADRPEFNDKLSSIHLLGVSAVMKNSNLFSSLQNFMVTGEYIEKY